MTQHSITLSAPAKLNLYLHIAGKNAKGYHLLHSGVTFVDLCDHIVLTPNQEGRDAIKTRGEFAAMTGAPDDNLIAKALSAVRRLCAEEGREAPPFFDVSLTKNIPVGAGLGGGSADAGAVLRYFFPEACSGAMREAARLGADVSVCMFPERDAVVAGVGDSFASPPSALLPLSAGVLLCYPRAHYSTPEIFKRYAAIASPHILSEAEEQAFVASALTRQDISPEEGRNDLYLAAGSEAKGAIAAMETLPGALFTRMTGSGSACFAVFGSHADAVRAGEILQGRMPEAFIYAARRHAP